jgi:Cu(I)/Ag(I) efflux system membrane fusion protein
MKTLRQVPARLAGLVALGLVALLGWWMVRVRTSDAGRPKVLFYQDSMHPWVKSDQPGKCTLCAMDLTPILAGQTGFGLSSNLLVLGSNSVTVLHPQATEARRRPLTRTLRVAGTLEADETRKTIVAAPAACRIQALTVPHVGVEVKEGQVLARLFGPDLIQKLGFLRGPNSNQFSAAIGLNVPNLKTDPYTGELTAPQSGVVVERNGSVGQYVVEGEKLLTIVDLSVLWFRFDVYENQLAWLEHGQGIEVVVPTIPGSAFPAAVAFVEPTLNEPTRSVKVRADLPNPRPPGQPSAPRPLRLGMYAEGRLQARVPDVLAIPRTAVLFPGGSAYAYVDLGDGAYERRRLKLGRQGDDLCEVLDGLDEGDRVVTAGNVLIDAQAQFGRSGSLDDPQDTNVSASEPAVAPDHASGNAAHHSLGHGDAAEPQDRTEPGDTAAIPGEMPDHDAGGVPASPQPAQAASLPAAETQLPAAPATRAAAAASAPAGARADSTPLEPALTESRPDNALTSTNRRITRVELSTARMAFKEEMWRKRMAAIAEAHAKSDTTGSALPETQRQALSAALAAAGELSRVLAADDLAGFNACVPRAIASVQALRKEAAWAPGWVDRIERLAAAASTVPPPAKDLDAARAWFLPFSTVAVDLAGALRKQESAFAKLRVYHCPMAPKPGLWLQSKGPLANPFFGAKMLSCGQEVRP